MVQHRTYALCHSQAVPKVVAPGSASAFRPSDRFPAGSGVSRLSASRMVVQNSVGGSAGALSCEALRRNQSTVLKIVTARPVPNKKTLTGVGIRSAFAFQVSAWTRRVRGSRVRRSCPNRTSAAATRPPRGISPHCDTSRRVRLKISGFSLKLRFTVRTHRRFAILRNAVLDCRRLRQMAEMRKTPCEQRCCRFC